MRRWSLATQMLVLQLLVVMVTVAGGAGLALAQVGELLTEEAKSTAKAVATSVASSPDLLLALDDANPSLVLQPYAERVRHESGVDFITIMDTGGRRYTHPNPAQIGGLFLGHIGPALEGQTFTETYTGTLGPSVRAVTPVKANGQVRALVSAGITVDKVSARLRTKLAGAALVAVLGLAIGAGGTWLVGRRLRRQTHGLGPVELARIHEHHDAILHTVREGLLLVGQDGSLILCNDAARTLLDLPEDAEGRPLHRPLDPGIQLVGDRVLAVDAAASELGTVVTVRDRTELQALTGQLDAERGFADSLRAAAHESANRLHTVITLVELGRTEQAIAFGTAELHAAQALTDRVMGAVREPVLAALLLGKSAEAAERGVELSIDEASQLDDVGLDSSALVTILGNLIDNAVEASAGRVRVLVTADFAEVLVEVADDGPGLVGAEAFEKGWTTKGDGRGLGLAMVGQAVRKLGGTIVVTRGEGAVFTVRLPLPASAVTR